MFAREKAQTDPDLPVLIMATSGETLTFGEYEARSNQNAHLFRDAGLKAGDHIAIFMENNLRMLEIEGGAERTGLYFTCINSYLAPDEVAYIINDSQSKVVIASRAKREVAIQLPALCPNVDRWIMVDVEAEDGPYEPYEPTVAKFPAIPVDDERLGAAMLYSSGTTGQPKGILRPLPEQAPGVPLAVMEFVKVMFGFREGMTYLSPAPLYHSAPQASVAATIRLGSTAVIMEHFDPEHWLQLVERYKVTNCQMVPTMFSRLLKLPEEVRAKYDTSSLEKIVHAAAPCPVPVKQAMIEWLGPIIVE